MHAKGMQGNAERPVLEWDRQRIRGRIGCFTPDLDPWGYFPRRYTPVKQKPAVKAQGTDQADRNSLRKDRRRTHQTARRTRGRWGVWENKKKKENK